MQAWQDEVAAAPRAEPPEWPHQLAAAGALAGIVAVWIVALPIAAAAWGVLSLAELARGRRPGARYRANERLPWIGERG